MSCNYCFEFDCFNDCDLANISHERNALQKRIAELEQELKIQDDANEILGKRLVEFEGKTQFCAQCNEYPKKIERLERVRAVRTKCQHENYCQWNNCPIAHEWPEGMKSPAPRGEGGK